MKIRLVLTAIVLASFQNFYAQEKTPITSADSVKLKTIETEKNITIQQNEVDQKSAQLEKDAKKLEKESKKFEKEQKKFEKEQKKIITAEKSVAKAQSKLVDEQKKLLKI